MKQKSFNFIKRLMKIDTHGIKVNKTKSDLKIYPNPLNNVIVIKYIAHRNEVLAINLYNSMLQIIINKYVEVISGTNYKVLNKAEIQPGTYYLHVSSENGIFFKKIQLNWIN